MIVSEFDGEILIKTSLSSETHIVISKELILSANAAIKSVISTGF